MQTGEEEFQKAKKEFKNLLGIPNDISSLYSRLIRMCEDKKTLRAHERPEAMERLQDTLGNIFKRYAREGGISNFESYCITAVKIMLNEFRREKSESIDYKKLVRNLRENLATGSLNERFTDFSSEARNFLSQIEDRREDSIDESFILLRLTELINIGKKCQGLDVGIIKIMEYWKSTLKTKIRENSRRVVSIDSWTNDEDGDGFNPFLNIPDSAPTAEEILIETQTTNQLYDCIDKLPTHYREFIDLYFFKEMGIIEAAKFLGKAQSTLSERNKNALLLLRECMTKSQEMRGRA